MKPFTGQVSSDMVLLAFIYIIGTMAVLGLIVGLGLIDSGLSRRKNTLNTWVQKIVAALIAGFGQALGGYALWQFTFDKAFGVPHPLKQAFTDWWPWGANLTTDAAHIDPKILPEADTQQVFFIFFVTFSMAVGAIIHSSAIERIKPAALYTMAFLLGFVLVPVVAFLTWGPLSPLTTRGLHDFEGVLTIYVFAGTWALVLAWRLRPRLGAITPHDSGARPTPHNVAAVGVGSLLICIALPFILLASGFIVPGSGYYGIDMTQSGLGMVFAATILAMIGGGVSGAVLAYLRRQFQWVFFGPITGVVFTGTILDIAKPWQTLFLGMAGPVVALGTSVVMRKLRIDEQKVVPLALGPGIVGTIACSFVVWGTRTGGYPGLTGHYALGHSEISPASQLLGLVIVIALAAIPCYLLCAALSAVKQLRVSEQDELTGGDLATWGVENFGDEILVEPEPDYAAARVSELPVATG